MISFLGFDGDLTDILEKVENVLGNNCLEIASSKNLSTVSRKVGKDLSICWLPGAEV